MSKNDDFQSIRTRGASKSYEIIMKFINEVGQNIHVDSAQLTVSLFENNDRAKVKIAKHFLNSIVKDFGKPDDKGTYVASGSFNDIFPYTSIERYPSWNVNTKDVITRLSYIDSLSIPSQLSYKPALSLVITLNFWLKHPRIDTGDTACMSSVILSLSQSSNSLGLTLLTPYAEASQSFAEFRAKIQAFAPIELKDKNFYIEKIYGDGKVTHRHAFQHLMH